jgi:hypothetical protein
MIEMRIIISNSFETRYIDWIKKKLLMMAISINGGAN